jgi:hypothetical protein
VECLGAKWSSFKSTEGSGPAFYGASRVGQPQQGASLTCPLPLLSFVLPSLRYTLGLRFLSCSSFSYKRGARPTVSAVYTQECALHVQLRSPCLQRRPRFLFNDGSARRP